MLSPTPVLRTSPSRAYLGESCRPGVTVSPSLRSNLITSLISIVWEELPDCPDPAQAVKPKTRRGRVAARASRRSARSEQTKESAVVLCRIKWVRRVQRTRRCRGTSGDHPPNKEPYLRDIVQRLLCCTVRQLRLIPLLHDSASKFPSFLILKERFGEPLAIKVTLSSSWGYLRILTKEIPSSRLVSRNLNRFRRRLAGSPISASFC